MRIIEKKVIQLAERLHSRLPKKNVFPLPLVMLIEDFGFEQKTMESSLATDHIAAIDPENRFFYINVAYDTTQQYIVLARLIGHVAIYGSNQSYFSVKQHDSAQPKEQLLDYFMQALLLPESLFKRKWRERHQNLTVLAEYFAVSHWLVSVRAKGLGLNAPLMV